MSSKKLSAAELDQEPESTPRRSELAIDLERLSQATISAAKKRERVPQPLFWSLFHTELRRLKKRKSDRRFVEEVFKKLG